MNDSVSESRKADLSRLYDLLARLEEKVGGMRVLADCHGRLNWPSRGVYFFFEQGECRSGSGSGARVVRVGTHGLKTGSRASLWNRLSTHGGTTSGGNHRGSIFRLLLGAAIEQATGVGPVSSWGVASDMQTAARRLGTSVEQIKSVEASLERQVSDYVRAMPVLWLPVNDDPGPQSHRGGIERCSIGLLSGRGGHIDSPSETWLGAKSHKELVRTSGLWNNRHVDEVYDPEFLNVFERHLLAF